MAAGTDPSEIVIVGAGVIGCAAARELAPDHEVTVLEKGQVAGNASGRASGLVTFSAQRSVLPGAVHHALEFYREYEGSEHFQFTERNGVELVPEGNEAAARARAEGAGFPLEFLDAGAVEDRYPGVFDLSGYVGGIEFGDTGWVDPYTLTTSLKDDAEAEGATVRTGVAVTDVAAADGAVTGVETDEGDVEADAVVVAAGWRTRDLLAEHVELPVQPLRYQSVNLRPADPVVDENYPMGWDPVTGFYWRPEHNGELHVGGDEYLVADPGSVRETVTEAYRTAVATEMPDRLNGFDRAEVISEDTCPTGDAATPDALPVIDAPGETPDGLVVAAGFHGYGIMEAPVGAAAVRSLVTGEDPPFPLDPYSLDRFDDRSADFDLVSLAEKREQHH